MSNRFRILKVLLVVFILAIVNMAVFFHVSGENGIDTRTTRAIEPDDEFLDLDWESLPNGGYPGDEIDFTFALDENYNGEGWLDENDTGYPGGVSGWIYDAKVQITTDIPIETAAGESDLTADYSLWNLEDTPQMYGLNFSGSSAAYVANEDGDNFFFKIKKDNVLVGEYTVTIRITYAWILDYDWGEHFPDMLGLYNWSNDEGRTQTRTETLTIDFEVYSCVNFNYLEPIRPMWFTSTGWTELYAGAQYQKVGVQADAVNPENHLKNVTMALTIPNTGETQGITLTTGVPHMGEAFIMDLYGWEYFFFYIDVAMHMPAGEKEGAFITTFYEREFDTDDDGELDTWIIITETFHYDVTFMIEYTPMLSVPEHNFGQDALITLDQKDLLTMERTISVDFVNLGNVDLYDIKVELYLEDSYYFDEETWYHMETSGYYQSNLDPEFYIGDLTVGQNMTATFDLSFFRQMPPATYALRIYYEAMYWDDGSTGESTEMIVFDSYDYYEDIMWAWGYETYPFYEYPYIIIEMTDVDGLDMYGWTNTYTEGAQDVTMNIYVMNRELYGLSDITVTLDGSGLLTDPIWGLDDAIPLYPTNSYNNDEHSISSSTPNWNQFQGGTYWYDQQRTFAFRVDINDNASDNGMYNWIYLDIWGFDKHHTEHYVRVPILITFNRGYADLIVTQAYSPGNLNPESEFEYTVAITNTGETTATDIQMLLRDNQDIIQVLDQSPIQTIPELAPGETATLTWNLYLTDKAMNTQAYTDRYSFTLQWGYTDWKNYTYDLGYDSQTVYLRTSPLEQVDPVQEVTPTFSSDQSQVLSYAIFAIAIIIGALVLMFGLARLASNVNKWRYEDHERKAGKTEAPREEAPSAEAEPEAPEAPVDEEVPEPPEEEEDDEPAPPEDEEGPEPPEDD